MVIIFRCFRVLRCSPSSQTGRSLYSPPVGFTACNLDVCSLEFLWCMVYGIWYMVYGIWYNVHGIWLMVYGLWCTVYGLWYMVYGVWCMVYGLGFRVRSVVRRFQRCSPSSETGRSVYSPPGVVFQR